MKSRAASYELKDFEAGLEDQSYNRMTRGDTWDANLAECGYGYKILRPNNVTTHSIEIAG